ncbi:soluble guanylate cyclase 88E-like [Babylonia areolata]|uniref:soluble guanylate cyclase 88E-like n=1 Tax=Babylonia areolata TaxID=304850 RepID=UPI003FD5057C
MKYIEDWDLMVYLCTAHVRNLKELQNLGLYLSDLNMFDHSVSAVIGGFESAANLEYYTEKEKKISARIEKNLELQSNEYAIRERFFRYLVPPNIASKMLRQENTCEAFDRVTILFSGFMGFDRIVNTVHAHAVVQLINFSLSLLDPIVERHHLFKVETRAEAEYMVAGGVEGSKEGHTQRMADLALEFLSVSRQVKCPLQKVPLTIRTGIHVGNVVSGVIGTLKRQYCLFGDAVNFASRIHTSGMAGRIHLSEQCHQELEGSEFVTIHRGVISLKGKGETNTYWLAGRRGDPLTEANIRLFLQEQKGHTPSGPVRAEDTSTAVTDNRSAPAPSPAPVPAPVPVPTPKDARPKGDRGVRERQ